MSNEILVKEFDKPLQQNIERLQESLNGISKVRGIQHRLSESFVLHFLSHFVDTPLTSSNSLSKSNWTHHVYFAIRSAAKALYLGCTFETMGRLDAVIDTMSDYPGVILIAEWESNPLSIFGENNELEKLWNGTHQHHNADAFLLTYCSIEGLEEFTKRVVEFWQPRKSVRENFPSLFLLTIAYKQEKRVQKFLFIRSLEITASEVLLWHDLAYVDTEEYLEAVRTPQNK